MKQDQKGVVLVQVLIMSVLLLFLATTLIRVVLYQGTIGAHQRGSRKALKTAEAILSSVHSEWSTSNVCTVGGAVTACNSTSSPCTCTVFTMAMTHTDSVFVTGASPGPYKIDVKLNY